MVNNKETVRRSFLVLLIFTGSVVLTSCKNEEMEKEIESLQLRISELENKNQILESDYQDHLEILESDYKDLLERMDFLEEELGYKVSEPNTLRYMPGDTVYFNGNKNKK